MGLWTLRDAVVWRHVLSEEASKEEDAEGESEASEEGL